MEDGFRGPQVCRYVGISYRQLDYWARTGLLRPSIQDASGSGTQRLYSFQDVVLLRTIKRLLDAGMSLQRVREAVDWVRENLEGDLTDVTLVSNGETIIAVRDDRQLVDALKGGQIAFTIAIGSVYEDLESDVAELRYRDEDKSAGQVEPGSLPHQGAVAVGGEPTEG